MLQDMGGGKKNGWMHQSWLCIKVTDIALRRCPQPAERETRQTRESTRRARERTLERRKLTQHVDFAPSLSTLASMMVRLSTCASASIAQMSSSSCDGGWGEEAAGEPRTAYG